MIGTKYTQIYLQEYFLDRNILDNSLTKNGIHQFLLDFANQRERPKRTDHNLY